MECCAYWFLFNMTSLSLSMPRENKKTGKETAAYSRYNDQCLHNIIYNKKFTLKWWLKSVTPESVLYEDFKIC